MRGKQNSILSERIKVAVLLCFLGGNASNGPVLDGGSREHEDMNIANSIEASQVATGIVTTIAAVISLGYTLGSDQRPLSTIDKLSSILPSMPQGPARDVLMRERDDRVVAWVLRKRSPQHSSLLFGSATSSILSMVLAAMWLLLVRDAPGEAWTWIPYGVSAALALSGLVLARLRRHRRDSWIAREKAALTQSTKEA